MQLCSSTFNKVNMNILIQLDSISNRSHSSSFGRCPNQRPVATVVALVQPERHVLHDWPAPGRQARSPRTATITRSPCAMPMASNGCARKRTRQDVERAFDLASITRSACWTRCTAMPCRRSRSMLCVSNWRAAIRGYPEDNIWKITWGFKCNFCFRIVRIVFLTMRKCLLTTISVTASMTQSRLFIRPRHIARDRDAHILCLFWF